MSDTQLNTKPISPNDLMAKLVNAKKVMSKVDGGDYTKGNIDESVLQRSASEAVSQLQSKPNTKNVASNVVNEDKINNSKLPDSIKQAMINNPIPTMDQISLGDGLDMDLLKGAKKLMEREGMSTPKNPTPKTKQTITEGTNNLDLQSLIKETIKNTLEEMGLTEVLSEFDFIIFLGIE
ncbi:hypothetical protein N9H34_01345 [bacterium]|nr:hypothetical protein [bacterium]